MSQSIVNMEDQPLKKCRAIVRFGPETPTGGFRPAEYFQATIDPNMVSPSGTHIRFGAFKGDELVGWQRIAAMTVCEVLQETPDEKPQVTDGYVEDNETVTMRVVVRE